MKKKSKKHSRHSKAKLTRTVIAVVCGIVVAFITWLIMRVTVMNGELAAEAAYRVPDFASLDDMPRFENGTYAVAIDGEVIAGQKSQEIRPTASMAKMILALAVIEKRPLELGERGETIAITDDFYQIYRDYSKNGGTVSEVKVDEEISEYDALVSVMLSSSNNMADTLAIWAFGSISEYQDYASEMLKGWGVSNTTIGIDASGFDESTTSTASDMVKIGTRVMQDPVLKEIVGLKEYEVPVSGLLENTNILLGQNNIAGIKTGYIGSASGYCLTSSYLEGDHIVVVTRMGASSREDSFEDSLSIIQEMQTKIPLMKLVEKGEMVGYYNSWWSGQTKIVADEDIYGLGWASANTDVKLEMTGQNGTMDIIIGPRTYKVKVTAEGYNDTPSLIDRIRHAFGWSNDGEITQQRVTPDNSAFKQDEDNKPSEQYSQGEEVSEAVSSEQITKASSANCTVGLGTLMLINPNFPVENDFIATRKTELVSISSLYGIVEGNPGNGDNLLDTEAATHINDMIKAYEAEYPGHTMETRSCFRAVGTNCGRLCVATGGSDHHTGLTCDLLDPAYGTDLNTGDYAQHIDWQWLKTNSYKYGFIDRFPEAWAGGPMSEPANIDENGSTGLYETWHYRYVGIEPATDIATGKYNNGEYDSLEHYLKARGLIKDLKAGTCE